MKCPNCGIDNPSSITVCQCGYSLATGPDLEKSLAKQAQEIREEVKKIHTVDSDVQAEVGEESKTVKGNREREISLSLRDNQLQEDKDTRMARAFGFGGILVWVLVILPSVWEWWFPETVAPDWKRILVAGLLAPFFYAVGAAIGASIAPHHSPTARR